MEVLLSVSVAAIARASGGRAAGVGIFIFDFRAIGLGVALSLGDFAEEGEAFSDSALMLDTAHGSVLSSFRWTLQVLRLGIEGGGGDGAGAFGGFSVVDSFGSEIVRY